jgi:transposase
MTKLLPLRQCLGIDVSKDHLHVSFSNQESDQRIRVIASSKFKNNSPGLNQLIVWIKKHRHGEADLVLVMEATGVYHEQAAYFLHEKGFKVSVLLPNKAKAFARSLNAKSKTDDIDAKILAQMGLERKLEQWKPASENMLKIKRLCRERVALQQHKTAAMNQSHACKSAHLPEKSSQTRWKQLIRFLNKQIKEVEQNIKQIVLKDPVLKEKVEKICVVKGLGLISVISIIAETDGFALFRNKAQLISFSGYDVVQRESGTSVKGVTRISKKGNSHIRRALHFPALVVVKHEKQFQAFFQRTLEKSFIKMKAYVAVQRKILVLIYTLYKNNSDYDPQYLFLQQPQKNRQEPCPA